MTRDEYVEKMGVPLSTVKQWTMPSGILHGERQPGVYTLVDVAVGRALLELQQLMGEKSAQAVSYAKQLAPHIRAALRSGATSKTFRVRIPGAAVTIEVDMVVVAEHVA